QDTYYGLEVLNLLNYPLPNLEKTVGWLLSLEMYNVYTYYYVGKSLELCGIQIDDRFKKYFTSIVNSKDYLTSATNVFAKPSTELRALLMILEFAKILKLKFNSDDVERWLLGFKNRDGGFGEKGNSNIISTYYAVASLHILKNNLENLTDVIDFVRECETPQGGFTIVPNALKTYIEFTYFGVMTLDILGEKCRFPKQTVDFVIKCQRANGGFARTDIGISTLENTFQAVNILRKLGKL
ncbi:MAG: prenyltransferase/squalene oxidase repeat-containing protein, partial [Candidatus Jordarchaeaceae archaeon]